MLRCGFATRDITPSHPVALHGYGSRQSLSDGVAEPIQLSCAALLSNKCPRAQEGGGRSTTLLLVAVDMAGIEETVAEELYALLSAEVGIGFPHVMLACSHTHFAPALQACRETSAFAASQVPDVRFGQDFRSALVSAAKEALSAMEPANLEVRTRLLGYVQVPPISWSARCCDAQSARLPVPSAVFNRRWRREDGSVAMHLMYPTEAEREGLTRHPVDDGLTLLRFRRARPSERSDVDNKQPLLGCLLNYGMHPVTGGRGESGADDFQKVSADYPHYVREVIGAEWQCPVLFTLGAAGDAVPMRRFGTSREQIGRSVCAQSVLSTVELSAPCVASSSCTL
jgi:hypothetical protein